MSAARAALPALRRWAPSCARPACVHSARAAAVPVLGTSTGHCSVGTRACGSSCSSGARAAASQSGCQSLPFCGPRTTYEGDCDEESWLEELTVCRAGFRRSNFVKERRCAEELRNKYTIGELLGTGATAKVYRAVNNRTGQSVAMKVIAKANVTDQQMLQSEIQIHKATDHPNVLRLMETFEDDCSLYLVTELCEGGDLWKHLASSADEFSTLQMPEEQAMQLFRQVVNSVVYLHSRGIAHRDLKPANFLFRSMPEKDVSGVIKLTDFGVSAYCRGRHRLTRTVGTQSFMAPEIIKNRPYDEKSDIFSIGCILHMLLTGFPPRAKDDGSYAISKIRLQFVSNQARDLIMQLMSENPEDRPSADEVARLPLLQSSRHKLWAKSERLDEQLLDQMYAYSSFPLLKKAAVVAMVSRAESDADFLAAVEKFMSLASSMTSGVTVDDIHEALSQELMGDMQHSVFQTLNNSVRPRLARPHGPGRVGPERRRHRQSSSMARARFNEELRAELEQLVYKIDVSGDGQLTYSEWLAATVEPLWYTDPQRIASAFRLFDFDGDGMISASDLKQVIPDVFNKLTVDAVLQESQLSAQQTSWLTQEQFALLLQTQNPSFFTLMRIANGVEDPLVANEVPPAFHDGSLTSLSADV